jgi:hypothetical protein
MSRSKAIRISDGKNYRVKLREPVEVLGRTLYPGRDLIIRGDLLKTIKDKVEDVHAV